MRLTARPGALVRRSATPDDERATRNALVALAGLRIGSGVAMLARPHLPVRLLGRRGDTQATWLVRMAAAREVALGLGTLHAWWWRTDPLPWVLGIAVADAGDAAALTADLRRRRVRPAAAVAVTVLAAAGAAADLALAARLRGPRRS